MKEAPALSLLFNREEENTDILLRCQIIPQKEKLFNREEADDQGGLLGI